MSTDVAKLPWGDGKSQGSYDAARRPTIAEFLGDSTWFDHETTRRLDHICYKWELHWDRQRQRYREETQSLARVVNELIDKLENAKPPARYHDHEDALAEYVRDSLGWKIRKDGKRWTGAEYESILEQGGFGDAHQANLVAAIAGRIEGAILRGQYHFEDMEVGHQQMLAGVITVLLYHRVEHEDMQPGPDD